LNEREIQLEEAKLLGSPTTWGLETKASGVDDWDDREWHTGIGQVGAASASIVLKLNLEEVLVHDMARVGRRLDSCDHEHILRRQFDLHTALLFEFINIVSNSVQVN